MTVWILYVVITVYTPYQSSRGGVATTSQQTVLKSQVECERVGNSIMRNFSGARTLCVEVSK